MKVQFFVLFVMFAIIACKNTESIQNFISGIDCTFKTSCYYTSLLLVNRLTSFNQLDGMKYDELLEKVQESDVNVVKSKIKEKAKTKHDFFYLIKVLGNTNDHFFVIEIIGNQIYVYQSFDGYYPLSASVTFPKIFPIDGFFEIVKKIESEEKDKIFEAESELLCYPIMLGKCEVLQTWLYNELLKNNKITVFFFDLDNVGLLPSPNTEPLTNTEIQFYKNVRDNQRENYLKATQEYYRRTKQETHKKCGMKCLIWKKI